jgi:SAM-dependent methyltransferase
MTIDRPICNYEGSEYSTEFWTDSRAYEDAVERMALEALLPPQGQTLIEIGAGFGRLADLYAGYDTVVIFDYARTQLEQAVERLGESGPNGKPQYLFVQGDFYHLPFVAGLFDTVTTIRTLHHAADAFAVLNGISETLKPSGTLVLESANKQNIKAIARYLFRRQSWSPFEQKPVEFVDLNFDFHPAWIWKQLERAGMRREAIRTVSHFRLEVLKRNIPTPMLAILDKWAQPTGALWQLSPSVFVRARSGAGKTAAAAGNFFCCPSCRSPLGPPTQERFHCQCGKTWQKQGAIYNFRDAV